MNSDCMSNLDNRLSILDHSLDWFHISNSGRVQNPVCQNNLIIVKYISISVINIILLFSKTMKQAYSVVWLLSPFKN